MQLITKFWKSGIVGKLIIMGFVFLILCFCCTGVGTIVSITPSYRATVTTVATPRAAEVAKLPTNTLQPTDTPGPTDILRPTNTLEPTDTSIPTDTLESTATPYPFASLDIYIKTSEPDLPGWEVIRHKENVSCASFHFSLSGGRNAEKALEEANAQAYLEILKDGEFFEGFGPYPIKDMDKHFDVYWFAQYSLYGDCVQTKMLYESDYIGMEFHLMLLHNDHIIAEFRGIRNSHNGWETSELSPEVVDRCIRKKVTQLGWGEPQYIGVEGYLKAELDSRYYDDSLPSPPWETPLLEQTGPELWEESGNSLPAKTPVVVLEQYLKHEGYGQYSGSLLVKSLEDEKEYRINVYHFVPTDYWNCPPYLAIDYSPFIARVKEDVQPIDRNGRWGEMGEQREVLCLRRADSETDHLVTNGVNCLMYKEYTYGFGGVEHIFPSDALEIIY